uniref:G-protein coupled receptor n=1 Tax=Sipha flava TaxID=143950 RepID=A0A2S2Q9I7_9HEMI
MTAVRSCFAAAVLSLVITYGPYHSGADDTVTATKVLFSACCTSPNDGKAACRIGNRTFHRIETIGDGSCANWSTAEVVPVSKCCAPEWTYDPDIRFCRPPAAAGGDETVPLAFRRLLQRLYRLAPDDNGTTTTVGYDYDSPKCGATEVLVDLTADEVELLPRDGWPPPDHCFDLSWSADGGGQQRLVARTCRPRDQYCSGGGYTCANKCCRGDRMIGGKSCVKSKVPFLSPIYEVATDGGSGNANALVRSNGTRLLPYYERLGCKGRDKLDGPTFKLFINGTLFRSATVDFVPATQYCLEYREPSDRPGVYMLEAYVCLADDVRSVHDGTADGAALSDEDTQGSWKYVIMLAGFVPSIVCLALTLLVYAMLSNLRNVHGYYVMCYVACLLMSFVCLLVIQWMTDIIDSILCKLFGYITLFAFLTTFCWLNVICFDIYWMLRYNNSINKHSSISIRTIIYNIYCWGFSSICIVIAFLFQHSQNAVLIKFAPNIGTNSCWFSTTDYGTIIFFLLPVSTMLIANLILFVLTAIHCSRIKSELNKFKRSDSKTQRFIVDKEKFVMSIKLFLVMGIPWSFEILSRIFHNKWIIWYILDEINALQGVMIFAIFVAKRQVIMSLRKKFTSALDHSESTKMHTISGSSQSGSAHKYNNDF